MLKTERPASWPYLGAGAPPLAEPVGRTLRSGVFHIAAHTSSPVAAGAYVAPPATKQEAFVCRAAPFGRLKVAQAWRLEGGSSPRVFSDHADFSDLFGLL